MKNIALLAGFAISLCSALSTGAQVRVNINLGAPVSHERWYAQDDDYYYLPEPGVYYNVRRGVYIYPENGGWFYAQRLPDRYRGCSYTNTRYYRIHERRPFYRNDYYRNRYAYREHRGQDRFHRQQHRYFDRHERDGRNNGHSYGHRRNEFDRGHHGRR